VFNGVAGEMTVPLDKAEWRSFYENIADALAGRAPLEVRAEQLVPQIAIAEAAYRSIETEQVVQVEL
jgi:predicted dehydrogenase